MTTANVQFYDSFGLELGNGSIDLDTHAFAVLLTTSAYTPNFATHTRVSDVTNELSGSGYARQTLSGVTWTDTGSGVIRFDFTDPVWTASGGSLVFRRYVLFDNTPATDATRNLVCTGLVDTTPADVTITSGNTFTLQLPANGLFLFTMTDS